MSLLSWLRNRKPSQRCTAPWRFRPALEMLEDRTVPATFNVTTPLDVVDSADGLLSLREAIMAANATSKADTIVLPAGAYALTRAGAGEDNALTGDLDIKGSLTIIGAGADSTIIDAGGLDRVFHVWNGTVTFSGMTIESGRTQTAYDGRGGGIYNLGSLTVSNCTISGNNAYDGGGIWNGGTLTVNNSLITGNVALMYGGGIWNNWVMTINNSDFTDNSAKYGGAVVNFGTASLNETDVSANSASTGGGIYNYSGKLTVSSSTLTNNSATNSGGGIYNGAGAKLSLRGSTLLANAAPLGADLYNVGTVTIDSTSTVGNICP